MAHQISSPLRLLVLAPTDTPYPAFLKAVETDPSHHEIRTSYYSASIPIWREVLPFTIPTIEAFQKEWKSPEAGEVVQAIAAWVVCFKKPRDKTNLQAIRSILDTIHGLIDHHAGRNYSAQEPLLLAVGLEQRMSPSLQMDVDEWDDLCRDCGGWEWIDGEIIGPKEGEGELERNEFGERQGISRLKEALEAHEWEGGDSEALSDDLDFASEDSFGAEAAQMERELRGLEMAVQGEESAGEGDGDDVEELENMMLKVQAIKDMSAEMPEAERRKFAAKAVRDVMKTL